MCFLLIRGYCVEELFQQILLKSSKPCHQEEILLTTVFSTARCKTAAQGRTFRGLRCGSATLLLELTVPTSPSVNWQLCAVTGELTNSYIYLQLKDNVGDSRSFS